MVDAQEIPSSTTFAGRWAVALASTYCFALAAAFFWTYLPRYFVSVGWSSVGIGAVLGSATLIRAFAMPMWARLAERTSSTTRIVQLVSTVGCFTLWALPFVRSTWAVYTVFLALYATWNAFLPLADSLTVRQLGSGSFGRVRAWGSAGFGLAAIGVAWAGAGQEHAVVAGWAPWTLAVLGTIGAASTWLFPGDEEPIRAPDLRSAARLLRRRALLFCLPLWALHWASQAPYNLFLVFLAEQKGMEGWVPGAAVAVGVAAEVLVLGFGRRLVRRLGPEGLFAICAAVTMVRWWLSAETTSGAVLAALQALHGLSFGGFLLAAMAILDREIPREVRDSGQAALYVVVFGLGSALGNSAAGWVNDVSSAAAAFRWAGALEAVVVVGAFAYWAAVRRQ